MITRRLLRLVVANKVCKVSPSMAGELLMASRERGYRRRGNISWLNDNARTIDYVVVTPSTTYHLRSGNVLCMMIFVARDQVATTYLEIDPLKMAVLPIASASTRAQIIGRIASHCTILRDDE